MTREAVWALIQEDQRLRGLKRDVEARLTDTVHGPVADDPAHDFAHFIRVALWTIKLSQGRADPVCAIAAALLHDIVNVPKNHPDRARASELSAEVARELLPKHGFTPAETDDICEAVRDHSFSRGAVPQRMLAKCLQDADRLEGLGSLGIFRLISTGVKMNAKYFDAEDPWARRRPLDDKSFSVDHFFTKLFKLPDLMNTQQGKQEALNRVALMKTFVEQLGEELGDPS